VFDKEGNITIVDRKKDMIIASGFNIFPNEIDDILFSHPKILEACTIGVEDDYRGETVKAYVVVRPGETLTEQEIVDFCKERLTAYKVPKKISFIEAIPKSAVGKILRRGMKDLDRELEKKHK
jgi:long-chain acyl-CoA synthetase